MTVGERIEAIRKQLGLTQDNLAKTVGCTAIRISRYERGEKAPTESELKRISMVFHVRYDWLCGNDQTGMFENGFVVQYNRDSVSVRLKGLRAANKITQAQLADRIGTCQASISRIEHKKVDLTEDLARKIARYFGVGEKWLIYGDEKYKDYPIDQDMIDWLWEHPEERKCLWEQKQGQTGV